MNPQKKKIIKLIPLFGIGMCIISSIVSIIIQNIPAKPTYTYINNCIITHTWQDIYLSIILNVFFIIAVISLVCIAILILEKIKNKEIIGRYIFFLIFSFFFFSIVPQINRIIVEGFWTKDDMDPSYYKFSDSNHTIVIEETSFLLGGQGTIYQINDDNSAVIIHSFGTDNGFRNDGHYKINWYDDYAEITYSTHISCKCDDKCKHTDKIVFVD